MMKRLGIYLIADRDGIVDRYIDYMLEKLKEYVTHIVIVSNGNVSKEGLKTLYKHTDDVYIRPNEGFDAGGFKDTIINYISIEKILEYDELLLLNDSFFGPIDSFAQVFETMENREDIDLWSLTKNMGNAEIMPSMQTYFVVFKRKVLHSKAFEEYWLTLPYYTEFSEAVEKYEKFFGKFFEDRGFKWDAYINDSSYDSVLPREYCFSVYHSVQYELMKKQLYPVVKRKLFAFNSMETDYGLERQGRENIIQTLDYIDEYTNYDVNMIWEQILRSYDLRNIQDSCCLRYIVPYKNESRSKLNVALFIWHEGKKWTFEMQERLSRVARQIKVYIMSREDLKIDIPEVTVQVSEKFHNKWEALIAQKDILKQYSYIAVLSDIECKATAIEPYSVYSGESWNAWENIVGKDSYMEGVTGLFLKNRSLGLLVTSKPVFAGYFADGLCSSEIAHQNEDFFSLARLLGVSEKIKNNFLADYSTSFWSRSEMLFEFVEKLEQMPIKRLVLKNCENVDKLLPYYMQTKRYYTATIESEKSASITETLCIDYLRDIISENKKNYLFSTYVQMKQRVANPIKNIKEVKQFIHTHRKVAVYGTGKIAKQLVFMNGVNDFDIFVVSNGQPKDSLLEGKAVVNSSEIDNTVDGIIMALNQKNTYAALFELGKTGYNGEILYLIR